MVRDIEPNQVNLTGFEERDIALDPGQHTITWSYRYNPFLLPQNVLQEQGDRIGALFLDNVYFVPFNSDGPGRSLPCAPLDPNPDSFEGGAFPSPPWSTGGAGDWALSTEQAYNGTTSIKSPNLDGAEAPAISNVTLKICNDDFIGGILRFQVIVSVLPPYDIFQGYIDGVTAAQLADVNEWNNVAFALDAGPHRVVFSYQYKNFGTFGSDQLPPSPPQRQGKWFERV